MQDEITLRERPTVDDWFEAYDPVTDENIWLTGADDWHHPESI